MSALTAPQHPTVAAALALARKWCEGHIIDEAPALAHAVRVARVLTMHVPDADPELVAAVLLHDSPEFAPLDVDGLDAALLQLGSGVRRVVRELETEHAALGKPGGPPVHVDDTWTLYASTADKIVALMSMLQRAGRSDHSGEFWRRRAPFVAALPYFRTFHELAAPHLPPGMAAELERLVAAAEHATQRAAQSAAHVPGRRLWWAPWKQRCSCGAHKVPCPDAVVRQTPAPAYWLGHAHWHRGWPT